MQLKSKLATRIKGKVSLSLSLSLSRSLSLSLSLSLSAHQSPEGGLGAPVLKRPTLVKNFRRVVAGVFRASSIELFGPKYSSRIRAVLWHLVSMCSIESSVWQSSQIGLLHFPNLKSVSFVRLELPTLSWLMVQRSQRLQSSMPMGSGRRLSLELH